MVISRFFIILFFIWLVGMLSLCPVAISSQLRTDKTTIDSVVLGRTTRIDSICDDFEDSNWKYDSTNHRSSNGFWVGTAGQKGPDKSDRGSPTILERVTPPQSGGKSGSNGALKIGTNIPHDDNISYQDDLRTLNFESKLGYKLTRANQPVFIMRIWLPPFDQWGDYYSFGFRLEAQSNDTPNSYYPSIWLRYNHILQINGENYSFPGPHIFFRIFYLDGADLKYYEEYGGPIKQPGWWTLAMAFDEKGACYYYARPGVDALIEKDKNFDDIQFMTKYKTKTLTMDYVRASLLSLGYREDARKSPIFEIDDYEVRIIK